MVVPFFTFWGTSKWARVLNRHFSKEDMQIANRHMKKCSMSLIIRECELNPQWDITSHLIRMTSQKTNPKEKCWHACGGIGTLAHFWWEVEWCSHYGKQCACFWLLCKFNYIVDPPLAWLLSLILFVATWLWCTAFYFSGCPTPKPGRLKKLVKCVLTGSVHLVRVPLSKTGSHLLSSIFLFLLFKGPRPSPGWVAQLFGTSSHAPKMLKAWSLLGSPVGGNW